MSAPIVIHRPSPTGGRRVTIRGQIVGLAYEDQDVVEFLRRAGLPVLALAAHPGLAGTHLVVNGQMRGIEQRGAAILDAAVKAVSQSAEAGAWPTLMAATADLPGGLEPSGQCELVRLAGEGRRQQPALDLGRERQRDGALAPLEEVGVTPVGDHHVGELMGGQLDVLGRGLRQPRPGGGDVPGRVVALAVHDVVRDRDQHRAVADAERVQRPAEGLRPGRGVVDGGGEARDRAVEAGATQ